MNLLLRLFAVGSLLTAAHTFAASAFEGKVTLTITGEKGRPVDMNFTMKGKRQRIDTAVEGHQGSIIMDMEKLEMLMLMPEQKMYMVIPIKQAVDKAVATGNDKAANVDVERTGKTEKILGYTCDQILVKDTEKGTVTELWVASDLGMFMGLGSGGGNPMMGGGRKGGGAAAAKWEEALKGKGGFPLRMISRDAAGKQVSKMEATKIEPGSQSESLFVPPEGYQKFQMPNFGGLLRGQ
jgi:hypothetical protein